MAAAEPGGICPALPPAPFRWPCPGWPCDNVRMQLANRVKRPAIWLAASGALAVIMMAVAYLWASDRLHRTPQQGPVLPPAGGLATQVVLFAREIHLQTDPRWAEERIGGSGEPMAAVGCTVCCISMALAEHGVSVLPGELNNWLREHGGYTRKGWVKWEKVTEFSHGRVAVHIPQTQSLAEMDAAIARGNPVAVKVLLAGGVPHWVLVVGKQGQEYLVKDPLGSGNKLDLLSRFPGGVRAVRVFSKVRQSGDS